jgi:hypothetical protein
MSVLKVADTVTGALLPNWAQFQGNVTFVSDGVPVGVPWCPPRPPSYSAVQTAA